MKVAIFFGSKSDTQTMKKAADILKEHKVNTAFEPGEELIYDLKYGIIKAGEFSISVKLVPVGYDYYFYVIAKCYTTGVAAKIANERA